MTYTTKDLIRDLGTGVIDPAHLQEFDPELVRDIKRELPSHVRTIAASVRQLDEPTKTVTYAATVEVVDRMGDLVLTKPRKSLGRPTGDGEIDSGEGFLPENFFAAGAPFLWSHLSRDHAVGQVTNSVAKKIETPRDGKLWATLQTVRYLFDERIPHAVPTWILVEEGIARSVSIGFVAKLIWAPDDETRAKIGLHGWGVVFLTSDQLELSQAQTPANQLALAQKAAEDDGATERASMAALERAVAEGREVCGVKMTSGLLADFLREFPVGPSAEQEVLEGRLAGFFDLGRVSGELLRIFDAAEVEPTEVDGPEKATPGPAEQPQEGHQTPERLEEPSQPGGPLAAASDAELALAMIAVALGLDPATCEPGGVLAAFEAFHVEHQAPAPAEEKGPAQLPPRERMQLRRAFDAVSEGIEALGEVYEAIEHGRGLDDDDRGATVDDAYLLARALVDRVRTLPPAARAQLAPTLDGGRAADARAAAGETARQGDSLLADFF